MDDYSIQFWFWATNYQLWRLMIRGELYFDWEEI